MHGMHISGMDLNLAVVLHALLEERSVSRAATRLGLSQSATSHALARLRHVLGDPLFVRARAGLVPTARAEAMADTLANALGALEGSFFAPPPFEPRTAVRSFRVASSDYVEHLIGPPLLTGLARAAPNLDLWTVSAPEEATEALAQGRLDLLFQPSRPGPRDEGLHVAGMWEDHFVGVMRKGHPLSRGPLTVERFAAAKHAFIAPRGRPGGAVDAALAQLGLSRRIAFTTPNFLVGPQVVAETDLVIVLAARIARVFAERLPLVLFEPPLELPSFEIAMMWHERRHADPAHRFLREEIVRVARTLPAPGRPRARAGSPKRPKTA